VGGSDDVSDRSESSRRRHWRIVERGRVLKRRKDANFRVPISRSNLRIRGHNTPNPTTSSAMDANVKGYRNNL